MGFVWFRHGMLAASLGVTPCECGFFFLGGRGEERWGIEILKDGIFLNLVGNYFVLF